MNKYLYNIFLLLAAISPLAGAMDSAKPAAPFVNPYLAASAYPITHSASDFTPVTGPTGPTRRLRADEVEWKPIGPMNGFAPAYSGPYPNGKRVIWLGGYDRVVKYDADTLEVLATYSLRNGTYFSNEEIERHVATLEKLDGQKFFDYNFQIWAEPMRHVGSVYHLLSRDNEFYLPYLGPDGTRSVRVYGDADAADPASKIVLRREWKIPPELSKAALFGMNITADGWIVMVTADGTLIALSRDLATQYSLKLPRSHEEGANQDIFASFVRNGIAADDQGGIYVVTRDHMHRVQWTGSKLSLDEADGAWSAPYPNEKGIGSGTTPGLMGWGPNEDHLVVIADATRGNNAMVFWRDKIPNDWKGIPGYDRRVAGVTPVHFGVSKTEQPQIENGPVIYGYGVFFDSSIPEQPLPDQGGPAKKFFADVASMNMPGHEGKGGSMVRWDAQSRTLKTAWQSQTNFAGTLCTVSGATEIIYCWGARNREWTLEGTDWNSGKNAFHYTLGKQQRYHPGGGIIIIAPNGAVDCGCADGLGIVRVKPRERRVIGK